jgi:hypothetical protein
MRHLAYLLPTLFGCYQGNPFAIVQPRSCAQLALKSPFLTEIDKRPSPDPIFYTNVSTKNDMWIIPADSAFMKAKCDQKSPTTGAMLKCNITLQDYCPNHPVDHIALPLDDKIATLVLQALQHITINLGCA